MQRKSKVPLKVPWVVAGALVVFVVLVGGIGVMRFLGDPQPTYVSAGDGVALGPATRHVPGPADLYAVVATGALSSAAGATSDDLQQAGDQPPTETEKTLLELTNLDRARNGLPPVANDQASLRVARLRATAQISDGPLSHYNSLGELAFVGLLSEAGVPYALAGENLARAPVQGPGVVQRLDEALMNSPTHRANILEPTFNRLAVGAASAPDGRIAVAEIFRGAVEPDNQADIQQTPL